MRYKTKPVEIEAIELSSENSGKIYDWSNGKVVPTTKGGHMIVSTLEGDMMANVGDFIIRGLKGEFYPCKPDIFHMKYDLISK